MFDRSYDYNLNRRDIEDREKFLRNIERTNHAHTHTLITLSCRWRRKQIATHERFMIVITRRISPTVSWRIRPRIAVNERDRLCERLALCADKKSGRLLHTCIDTIIVSHVGRIRCLRVFAWAPAINLFFSEQSSRDPVTSYRTDLSLNLVSFSRQRRFERLRVCAERNVVRWDGGLANCKLFNYVSRGTGCNDKLIRVSATWSLFAHLLSLLRAVAISTACENVHCTSELRRRSKRKAWRGAMRCIRQVILVLYI